jgi:hypothetical protein
MRVQFIKRLVSSMTVTTALMLAEIEPIAASTQANLSPAIDYMVTETLMPDDASSDLTIFNTPLSQGDDEADEP